MSSMPTRSRRKSRPSPKIDKLFEAVERLAARGAFRRSDIVRWREKMANKALPLRGEPAIVVQQDEFGIVLMIAVGPDGVGVPVWTDAWRLERFPAQQRGKALH